MQPDLRPAYMTLTIDPPDPLERRLSHPHVPPRRKNGRWLALLALALLIPIPTVGAWFGLYWDSRGTGVGQALYFASKLWILLLPTAWLLLVDREPVSFSPMKRGGLKAGVISGLAISAAILIGWVIAGQYLVDPATVRATASASGIGNPLPYLIFALYLCTINAVLEEYVWRWFVFSRIC